MLLHVDPDRGGSSFVWRARPDHPPPQRALDGNRKWLTCCCCELEKLRVRRKAPDNIFSFRDRVDVHPPGLAVVAGCWTAA